MPKNKQSKARTYQSDNFWENKSLHELSEDEWESLCDGCGRCCLEKIDYTDIKMTFYTNSACKLLDLENCRCSNYQERKKQVPGCVKLTPEGIQQFNFMPDTCAYRILAEGKKLKSWHPLVSGDKNSVHAAGISVRGRVVSCQQVDDLEEHIIDWIRPSKRSFDKH